jgi:hypothetical protein
MEDIGEEPFDGFHHGFNVLEGVESISRKNWVVVCSFRYTVVKETDMKEGESIEISVLTE